MSDDRHLDARLNELEQDVRTLRKWLWWLILAIGGGAGVDALSRIPPATYKPAEVSP